MVNSDRLIALGDVHGCTHALDAVLEAIAPQPRDTLVFLGDLIDQGRDSRGVLECVNGTATDGVHYTAVSRDVYFAPNQTSAQVGVVIQDDTIYETSNSPYFFATLSSPLNAAIGTATGYAILLEDDPVPTLSIADTTVTEGDPGGSPVYASFTLSLTSAADFAITASVLLGPGTALTPADYTPLHALYVVTIAAGQTSGTVLVRFDG